MPRGRAAELGTETVNAMGYTYVKTENGWVGKHFLVAAKSLGRPIDNKTELVRFKDGDKTNFHPDNIVVVPRRPRSDAAQRARLESQIQELQAQLDLLS